MLSYAEEHMTECDIRNRARMKTEELKINLQVKFAMAKGSLNIDGVTLRTDAFGSLFGFNAWIFIALIFKAML